MKTTSLLLTLSLPTLSAPLAHSQTFSDFVFNTPVQTTDGNFPGLGDSFSGNSIDFLNIAPISRANIDARITATILGTSTFDGHFPSFRSATANEPNDDVGFLFLANTPGASGIDYTFEFFVGGTNFSTPFLVPDFRFLIYDVDGDPSQSESVAASTTDGFIGYQLPTTDEFFVIDNGTDYTFNGPGANRAETDPSAAVVLYFQNTSSATFSFRTTTTETSPFPNGVFSAIDGDLSLFGGVDPIGDSNFSPFVAVPEPSAAALLLAGTIGTLLLRRR